MPFGFLGGAHFTSMSAGPIALTIGALSSLGGASAVLEYVWPPTPHPPTKPEICVGVRALSSAKKYIKSKWMSSKEAAGGNGASFHLISLLNTHLNYHNSTNELLPIFTSESEEQIGSKWSFWKHLFQ